MSEKKECDQRKSISQLPVVEGSLRWTSSEPGASEGSSHSTQASSPAGQRPPPPVPPSCLLPSSSANDRGGCQLACCCLVQQQLFIYPLPCAGSGLSATGEIRQTGREGQGPQAVTWGRGRGQEGLLHIRVVAGVLDAARVKLRQEAGEEASHMESHGKRVPGYETTAPSPVWTGDLA